MTTRVPSTHTKVGDRVRECFDAITEAHGFECTDAAKVFQFDFMVKAFDIETGGVYGDASPTQNTPLIRCRRIRSWVRITSANT